MNDASDRNTLVVNAPFAVLNGYLAIYHLLSTGAMVQVPLPEQLVYVSNGNAIGIRHMAQLVGRVRISSAAAAAAFVRLPTSLRTWGMMASNPPMVELDVTLRSELNAKRFMATYPS